MAEEEWMDLADAITLLRDQVAEARKRLENDGDGGVLFGLGEITLELGMELAHTGGANAGLRFSVVSIGGKKEKTDRSTHKLTVRLDPHYPDGRPVNVRDKE
ncbi:hypothetical protein IQ62_08460 [Streptomyces scabiei]|uniref:trypco2 family protein n=1 Tax=Streptomyces scabiei TaxID=1930 RepID=UPI0004E702DB|nr:trypco2 family protein [Streptomyces scabiei]KFG01316.1 hypothetical protein IQ62_08460 [Streptomyces scabiei]